MACAPGISASRIPKRTERLQQPRVSQHRFGLDAPHPKTPEAGGHPLGGLQQGCLPDARLTLHHQRGRRPLASRLEQGTHSREFVDATDDLTHHVGGFPPRERLRPGATVQGRQVV